MNGTLVTTVNNSNIYLINDQNISYYLSIPNNNEKLNISINIYDNINNDNISNVLSKINRNNLCIISPIFSSEILKEIVNNNQNMFINIDKYISYLINVVYNILKSNNKIVDSKIVLINYNTYSGFNSWFTDRYKERVNSINLDDNSTEFKPTDITNIFKKEELGIPVVDTLSENRASNVLEDTQSIVTNSGNESKPENKDMGFISYVLLGVVVAVTSLLLLYLLI